VNFMNENAKIYVNGILEHIASGSSIGDLLNSKTIEPARVVVEVNQNIIKRDKFDSYRLTDSDKVEILRFVGGG
jgi:sulfur carrier protein